MSVSARWPRLDRGSPPFLAAMLLASALAGAIVAYSQSTLSVALILVAIALPALVMRPRWTLGVLVGTFTFDQITLGSSLDAAKLIAILVLVAWGISLALRRKNPLDSLVRLDWLVLGFLLLVLATIVLRTQSGVESDLLTYGEDAMAFVMIRVEVQNRATFFWTLGAIIAGAACASLVAVAGFFGTGGASIEGIGRLVQSFHAGINVAATEDLGILGLGLALWATLRSEVGRTLLATGIVLLATIVVFSYSRGTWLGTALLAGSVIASVPRYRHIVRVWAPVVLAGILGLLFLLALAAPTILRALASDPVVQRLVVSNFLHNDHYYIFKVALLTTIPTHPFIGWGIGNLPLHWRQLASATPGVPEYMISGLTRDAHSLFLDIAASMGIPIFLLFMSAIICTYRLVGRSGMAAESRGDFEVAWIARVIRGTYLGFFVSAFFVPMENRISVYILLGLASAFRALTRPRGGGTLWRS